MHIPKRIHTGLRRAAAAGAWLPVSEAVYANPARRGRRKARDRVTQAGSEEDDNQAYRIRINGGNGHSGLLIHNPLANAKGKKTGKSGEYGDSDSLLTTCIFCNLLILKDSGGEGGIRIINNGRRLNSQVFRDV